MSQHLEPCPHCGEHCMSLVVDQGDKWAHYEPSCTEVRTGYDLSPEAPWRAEAVAAWNTRTPPKTQAPDAGATPDTSTLPPQGDLGNSGGLIERLRKTNLTFITTDDPNSTGGYCRNLVDVLVNPDGPEAAAEIERLRRELKKMFLSWQAADMQAGENWAKLKLARGGVERLLYDFNSPRHKWVEARLVSIIKTLGTANDHLDPRYSHENY